MPGPESEGWAVAGTGGAGRKAVRNHHLQTGVGHYGVFSGRRWATEVYPRVRQMIQANS